MVDISKCWDVMNSYNIHQVSDYIQAKCLNCYKYFDNTCPYFGVSNIEHRLGEKMRGKSPLLEVTGIKYDQDKLRLAEMIVDFAPELQELCKVWTFGANKYAKSNWKLVENGKDRYSNALLRHLIAEDEDLYDDESKLLHAAHIAFNALARMHFILEDKKEKENGIINNEGS